MARQCAANSCDVPVRPGVLMCRPHWFMVPKHLRDAIWATYRDRDWEAYGLNVIEARRLVSEKEGRK